MIYFERDLMSECTRHQSRPGIRTGDHISNQNQDVLNSIVPRELVQQSDIQARIRLSLLQQQGQQPPLSIST